MNRIFTSESVSEGHPDKICDQISDAIVDECLRQDANSRVACECLITNNNLIIAGEITTNAILNYKEIAQNVIKNIGYDDVKKGLDYKKLNVKVLVNTQSPDIAMGVDNGGAGDQGMVFGFANLDTPQFMPLPITLANEIMLQCNRLRKSGSFKYANPDMKCQVSFDYDKNRVETVLCSIQHDAKYWRDGFEFDIKRIITEIMLSYELNLDYKLLINPTGRFVIGGPQGDAGLTGRKIIVDTYGGFAHHGGGAFSGKDPTKIDRSGAYMARFIAKNLVANGFCRECEIQISYAIGVKEPVAVFINTFNTETIPLAKIYKIVWNKFDLTPNGIIKTFDLKRPIYLQTAAYGHFTNQDLPWEKVVDLKNELTFEKNVIR